jgi:hypothetical protein
MTFKQGNNEDLLQSYNRFFKLLSDCPPYCWKYFIEA